MSGFNENQTYIDLMRVVAAALVEADDLIGSGSEAEKRYLYDPEYRSAVDIRARQVIYRLHKMP